MELCCAGRGRRDVAQTLPGGGRCSGLAHAQGPHRVLQQLQSCPQPGLAALGNCKRITRGYLLCLESKNSDLGSELNKECEQMQLLLVQRPQTGEELRGAAVAPAAGFCSEGRAGDAPTLYPHSQTDC